MIIEGEPESPSQSSFDDEEAAERLWTWKKNVPLLYDVMFCHRMDRPSLTVEWSNRSFEDFGLHLIKQFYYTLTIGTFGSTDDEPDYLQLLQVTMNQAPNLKVVEHNDVQSLEFVDPTPFKSAPTKRTRLKVDLKPQVKMVHPKEVNRARFMPQDKFVIGTRTVPNSSGFSDVLIYKYNRFKQDLDILSNHKDVQPKPNVIFRHHTAEGHGISWNPHTKGELLTCGKDRTICLWSLKDTTPEAPNFVKPDAVLEGEHTDSIEDVAWGNKYPTIFCSVGNDSKMCLWDKRNIKSPFSSVNNCHSNTGINSVNWHPSKECLLATGGGDGNTMIWDVRKISSPLYTLTSPLKGSVQVVQWAPFKQNVIATGCSNGKICIWDLGNIGEPVVEPDNQIAPPELLFVHEGHHSSVIYDLSWNREEDWMIASVASDSTLHVWKMDSKFYK